MNVLQRLENVVPARLRRYITLYVVVGLVVCIVSLLIFVKLVDSVSENESMVRFDVALANALHNEATAGSTAAFRQITLLGNEILFAWCAVVGLLLALQKRWLAFMMWGITIAGGEVLNMLLKQVFARPRPTFAVPLVIEHSYSFPSGHAMMSFIAYGMLAYMLCRMVKNGAARLLIVVCAGFLILVIGLSRIVLGVHYFSDVLAAFSAGALWLIMCITIWRSIQQQRATPSPTA